MNIKIVKNKMQIEQTSVATIPHMSNISTFLTYMWSTCIMRCLHIRPNILRRMLMEFIER